MTTLTSGSVIAEALNFKLFIKFGLIGGKMCFADFTYKLTACILFPNGNDVKQSNSCLFSFCEPRSFCSSHSLSFGLKNFPLPSLSEIVFSMK